MLILGVILLATILRFSLGALWYMPNGLFGKTWLKLQGIDEQSTPIGSKSAMVKGFLLTFISTAVLSLFLVNPYELNIMQAIFIAFLVWLGFTAPIIAQGVIYDPSKRRGWKLFAIDASYEFVGLAIAAIVLVWVL
jgi:hypothetical protein